MISTEILQRPEFRLMRNGATIAIDFDGTIADTNVIKAEWIKNHLGFQVPPRKCDRTNCVPIIGSSNYETMATFVCGKEGTNSAEPFPGAIQGIKTLALGFVLYVFTNRKAAQLAFAQKWLTTHSIREFFEAVISSADSEKSNLCRKYDGSILIDDDLRNLSCCKNGKIRIVLFKPGPEDAKFPAAVLRVKTWPEFLKYVSGQTVSQ